MIVSMRNRYFKIVRLFPENSGMAMVSLILINLKGNSIIYNMNHYYMIDELCKSSDKA